jgi:hypothetical protein
MGEALVVVVVAGVTRVGSLRGGGKGSDAVGGGETGA